jgi:hypothetical protein
LKNVGRLCRWIESTHSVPVAWPNGFPNPPVNGKDPGHHNRNKLNWTTKGGHYGHCHVPVNVHWDPAYTAEEVAFVMSVSATDTLELVSEKEELPAMNARAIPRASAGKTKRAQKARPGQRRRSAPKVRPK